MHTITVILGIVADIIMALALISLIVGLIWIVYPLKNKIYMGGDIYRYTTPLGGRETGIIILISGVFGLALGFALDKVHFRMTKKFGARI